MGILFQEVLKGICNSYQWCYAVFWKIGCQNPKLLIWEECHYEALPSSVPIALEKGSNRFGIEAENEVCLLVNKMMLNNQINVVGEGIVGRAAFSGNHFWILSTSYNRNTHPPEVLNELHNQFSAGMQTIAVIPVFPHGVVQLGSPFAIIENMRFVNEVKSLILHLGSIPGALLPENYAKKDSGNGFRKIPCSVDPYAKVLKSSMVVDSHNLGYSCLLSDTVDHNLSLPTSSLNFCDSNVTPTVTPNHKLHGQWFDLQSSFGSRFDFLSGSDQSSGGYDCLKLMDQQIPPGSGFECNGNNNPSVVNSFNLSQLRISGGLAQKPGSSKMDVSLSSMINQLSSVDYSKIDNISSKSLNAELIQPNADRGLSEHKEVFLLEQNRQESGNQNSRLQECKHTSADDLFDVLGVKLRNKLLDRESIPRNLGVDYSLDYDMHDSALLSDIYSSMDGVSDSAMLSYCDHLLDAVVSGGCLSTKLTSGDDASQKTNLTKMSSSPTPSFSCGGTTVHLQKDLFELPSQLSSSGTLETRRTKSGCGKNDMGSCSQSNSVYGSQISSWVEQGKSGGQDNSASTAHSKRPTEVTKSNRKRQKPGENPKPRPKDRQMFQDRLKELREIVPNGAKYSIDALLERTVKHMVFLQSVTKHADKLKQTSESKMQSISKENGLLLKDNLEGGATWAFEVGSESMVCPLIVKDLNPPRQMLVEMLCEDRGLFLEIADLIRGLGLTILKGVMETRSDKIWARFSVEANRDVTRMEIFMSLVHLLEQTMKGGGPCLADATNNTGSHLLVHNSSPQTAPVPATGGIE